MSANEIYEFTLTGTTDLLMHADDVDQQDEIEAWRKAPSNKNVSRPGDDRSPAWTWLSYLYTDGPDGRIVLPQDNLMAALRKAGAMVQSKGMKTYKDMTQYGIIPGDEFFPLLAAGKEVPIKPLFALAGVNDFLKHRKAAEARGFKLFTKRAKIGKAKHVRVRPRFDDWQVKGRIQVTEQALTEEVLGMIFELAGQRVGLGDWRPSAPMSGPYGRFAAELVKVS